MACRYVENGSLANIIKPNKFGPFPESLVAVYIAQVCLRFLFPFLLPYENGPDIAFVFTISRYWRV